jgi:hypothetical protein
MTLNGVAARVLREDLQNVPEIHPKATGENHHHSMQ